MVVDDSKRKEGKEKNKEERKGTGRGATPLLFAR